MYDKIRREVGDDEQIEPEEYDVFSHPFKTFGGALRFAKRIETRDKADEDPIRIHRQEWRWLEPGAGVWRTVASWTVDEGAVTEEPSRD